MWPMATKKRGGVCENVIVDSIEHLHSSYCENEVIIICSSRYEDEIRRVLYEKGITNIMDKIPYIELVCYPLIMHRYQLETGEHLIDDIFFWLENVDTEWLRELEKSRRLYCDERSRFIIQKRLQFYETGALQNLMDIPIDSEQYFLPEIWRVSTQEVFVDCGAYNGDSIEEFVQVSKGQYKKIFAFEPDKENFNKLCNRVSGKRWNAIELENCGVGSINGSVGFENLGSSAGYVRFKSKNKIKIVKLDDVIHEEVTFIKMDIEGSELEALKGAEN